MQTFACADYYGTVNARALCHSVKDRNIGAIREMARLMTRKLKNLRLPENTALVPVPNHEGYAVYTKILADEIAKKVSVPVFDILKADPYRPLYEQKKENGNSIYVPVYAETKLEDNILPVLIDNVTATGTTIHTCETVLRKSAVAFVFAIDCNRVRG